MKMNDKASMKKAAQEMSAHQNVAPLSGVILDEASFNANDLDLSRLIGALDHWQRYPSSTAEEALLRITNAQCVVANKVRFDRALLDAATELKLICLTTTGTDNVDLAYCAERGISVMNVTDYGTPSVSQHVLALMLALSTRLLDYNRDARNGTWSNSRHFSILHHPISELHGKTLGIIGLGALGKGVEKLAKAFDMKVLIANRPGGTPLAGRIDIQTLLPQVDVLSLHCPLTSETKHLIDATALKRMKPSALLINTARGAIVNNVDLAQALINGDIAGAGIDVIDQEPPASDHPLLDPSIPNLILTPHTAWASIEARQRLLDKVADNLLHWINS